MKKQMLSLLIGGAVFAASPVFAMDEEQRALTGQTTRSNNEADSPRTTQRKQAAEIADLKSQMAAWKQVYNPEAFRLLLSEIDGLRLTSRGLMTQVNTLTSTVQSLNQQIEREKQDRDQLIAMLNDQDGKISKLTAALTLLLEEKPAQPNNIKEKQ